jgi:SAM-dependent methyltransferase
MFEPMNSDVNVEELMHEIRETVARRRREITQHQSDDPSALQNLPLQAAEILYAPLIQQPPFHPHPDGKYHRNDFLSYHGGTFVRNAYIGLLRREPDAESSGRFAAELASGRLNKVDVLARIHNSPEGRASEVKVSGLAGPAFIRRLQRLPVVGYLLSLVIAVARLPGFHRHFRQSEFYLQNQQERLVEHYDRIIKQSVQPLVATARELTRKVAEHQQMVTEHQQEIASLVMRDQERSGELLDLKETTERSVASLIAWHKKLEDHISELQDQFYTQQRQQAVLGGQLREYLSNKSLSIQDLETRPPLDELYASFEDEFRGTTEEIKSRLEVYLPVVRKADPNSNFLDVGCGRGEWLEVLRDAGMQGYGIDQNSVQIARCREKGLQVMQAEAITHLQSLPDASVGFITGFHIVEHLPFDDLIRMLDQMLRVLKPAGAVILETPNPENFMVGSCTFYTDPTHRHPIPSPTLKFLLDSRGFASTEVMKLREWDDAKLEGDSELIKRFNEYFYSAPDYAVVGWKSN